MSMGIVFRVEVCNGYEHGFGTAISLDLPAGPHELLDAFSKARINEGDAIETELLETELDFLYERLPGNPDLFDINHLAQQLAAMEDWQLSAMEGLCEIAAVRNMGQPIPVAELVNMANSLDDCQIAYGISNDEELGRFYDENDMLPETEGLPEQVRDMIDYRALGEKRRLAEGGVFTRAGYVVLGSEISQDYVGGQQTWPQRPEMDITATLYPMEHRHREGCASKIRLDFPLTDYSLPIVLAQIGVTSLDECNLRMEDCAAPQMMLSIERHFRKYRSLDEINDFAETLDSVVAQGELVKYNAMLAAAECTTLEAANRLAEDISQCEFDPNITSPSAYAAQRMTALFPGIDKKQLSQNVSLDALGRLLLQAENVYHTEYGAIRRSDGQPLLVQSQVAQQHMAPAIPDYDEPGEHKQEQSGPIMTM